MRPSHVLATALVLAAPASLARAQDKDIAVAIFGNRIAESFDGKKFMPVLQDMSDTKRQVQTIRTANCKTVFGANGYEWAIDWASDAPEVTRGNKSLLLLVSDKGPIGLGAGGRDDANATFEADFDRAQDAMERLWGICSR